MLQLGVKYSEWIPTTTHKSKHDPRVKSSLVQLLENDFENKNSKSKDLQYTYV